MQREKNLNLMKITTKSGSRYEIDGHGICRKYDSNDSLVDSFKVFVMKSVPTTVTSMGEVWDYPNSNPQVGKLMYIGGLSGYWISTEVMSIEGEFFKVWPPEHFRDKSNGE